MDMVATALSALRASSAGLEVRANNVANQFTAGYQAGRVDLMAEASGGVRVSGASTDPTPAGPGNSNVDLVGETVAGMGLEILYRANLKVLKTADELMQASLDLKA